ncbi:MAG: DUF5335 family protein [Chloroflexota bacterium]
MQTSEILRGSWTEFFQDFTSDHDGNLVNLVIKGWQPNQNQVDTEARVLPLREISADLKDHENSVMIAIGSYDGELLRHEVQKVSHVRLIQTDNGSDSALQIESATGQTATIEFSPALANG